MARQAARAATRRYPAVAYLAAAAALSLLLPTGLNVLQSGPSSLAEVAPVPGEGDAPSDLSQLQAASSPGVGSGGSRGGARGAEPPATEPTPRRDAGLVRRRAGTKRCVGNPPRQTEDPLSPPCIAFFDGDNGGATSKGVTGEEIAVVVHMGTASNTHPRGLHDLDREPEPNEGDFARAARAYGAYFTERYQLYGRRLHMYTYYGSSNEDPDALAADVGEIDGELGPFAIVALTSLGDGNEAIAGEAARRRIVGTSYAGDLRAAYAQHAPYRITFTPDIEDQAAIAGAYICTKLARRPARWHGDVTARSQTRRFAMLTSGQPGDLTQRRFADALDRDLRARCDQRSERAVVSAAGDYPGVLAGFRTAGVTTVIIAASSGVATNASHQAATQGWFPEWFIPGGGSSDVGADTAGSGQLANQQEWRAAFGITFDYRRAHYREQPWYVAYREGCTRPDCVEPRADISDMYDNLALLAYGIQAAGPRLSAATLDQGLHAIPPKPADDPYRPAAYFAPGNYSFVKDAAEIWWDPTGVPPGDSRLGCFRLVRDGVRYRAIDWTGDDSEVFSGSPACQAAPQRPTSTTG